jgi:hypothetical protein
VGKRVTARRDCIFALDPGTEAAHVGKLEGRRAVRAALAP